MAVTPEDVLHIARLARLSLEPGETERLAVELSGILAHVRALNDVDVEGVEPFEIPAEHAGAARPDEAGADPLTLPLTQIATAMRAGYFTVPRLYGDPPTES